MGAGPHSWKAATPIPADRVDFEPGPRRLKRAKSASKATMSLPTPRRRGGSRGRLQPACHDQARRSPILSRLSTVARSDQLLASLMKRVEGRRTRRRSSASHSLAAGAGRDDQHRTASDADEAIRDATEKRRFEPTAPTRADDDQFGILVVCQICQPFGGQPHCYALFGFAQPRCDRYALELSRPGFLLLLAQGRKHRWRRNSPRSDPSVRHGCDVDDVGENEPRSEPFCQPCGYADGGLRVGRPIDTTNDRCMQVRSLLVRTSLAASSLAIG
jgi:hypothetical protein